MLLEISYSQLKIIKLLKLEDLGRRRNLHGFAFVD